MLSYRHAFHAGNFADVFKHVVLTMLLTALSRKDKPFVYLDTHAGAGRYDLRSEMARKNREFEGGIGLLWGANDAPAPVAAYLDAVRAVNHPNPTRPPFVKGGVAVSPPLIKPVLSAVEGGGKGGLRWYPGSPRIARHLLREHDRMLLAELHSSEVPMLRREFRGDRQVQVLAEDGYHALKSKLPPREHRGLVLIDPAYERRDEIVQLLQGLSDGHRRFATGVFAIWYPIMPKIAVRKLHKGLIASGLRKVLVAELCIYPDDNPLGINGSGMIVVNPPWQFDAELKTVMPWLWRALSHEGQGRHRVEWLVAE